MKAGCGAYESPKSPKSAREYLAFEPIVPRETLGAPLSGIRVFVRDHKGRDVPREDRTMELHYGDFAVSQSRKGEAEARRLATEVSYGRDPRDVRIAGNEGRAYALGPDVALDDAEGREPAVIAWHDGEMFYLIASTQREEDELLRVAESLY